MGLSDPKSSFGSNGLNVREDTVQYHDDGRITYQTATNFVYGRHRAGKSSNRRRPIGDTSTLWIPNSNYERSICLRTKLAVGRYYNVVGKVENQFYPPYSDSHSYYPWKGRHWAGLYNTRILEDSNAMNRCITECLLKLKDAKAELGANLATAKQTYNMFADNAFKLVSAYRAARRGNWRGAVDHLGISPKSAGGISKNGAARWLEYQYGWKPLMSDIYGLKELLEEQTKSSAMLLHARRVLRDTVSGSENAGQFLYEENSKRSHTVHLTARVSDRFGYDVSRAGLINPLTIAWEVVPWSFLVDWVMPVGNVLEALDATHGLTFVGGFRTVRGEGSTTITQLRNGSQIVRGNGRSRIEHFSVVREALFSFPQPIPYFKSPFSTPHALNALALIRTLIR